VRIRLSSSGNQHTVRGQGPNHNTTMVLFVFTEVAKEARLTKVANLLLESQMVKMRTQTEGASRIINGRWR
jgi:hypothetical protein